MCESVRGVKHKIHDKNHRFGKEYEEKTRYFVPNLTFFLHIWEIICNFAADFRLIQLCLSVEVKNKSNCCRC